MSFLVAFARDVAFAICLAAVKQASFHFMSHTTYFRALLVN